MTCLLRSHDTSSLPMKFENVTKSWICINWDVYCINNMYVAPVVFIFELEIPLFIW